MLEHPEGFGRIVPAHHLGRIEDVAQLVAGQAVEAGVGGVQLGAQYGTALRVPGEGWAGVAEVGRPGLKVVGCVAQFQNAGNDVGEIGGGVAVGRKNRELLVVYRSFCKFQFARCLLGGERRRIAPEVPAQQAARWRV
ncbi:MULTISPECIES: hypothetical protein [Methylococcus]|uniref:Uncharacterized protein n=1 Tax=Methylococcus capsulatus TaxID=414 RepID=A0ABZ2F4Z8_METCP|nr:MULTISPECIES: hypothetical protein [Methylococcus]